MWRQLLYTAVPSIATAEQLIVRKVEQSNIILFVDFLTSMLVLEHLTINTFTTDLIK